MSKKRLTAYLLSSTLIFAFLFLCIVMLYSGLGRVTDTTLKEREASVQKQEQSRDEQVQQAEYWRNAEKEYIFFRQKVLLKLDRFAELRRLLDEKIDANRLSRSGVNYQNQVSSDGKLVFVRFSFSVEGTYVQVKHLIWDLERLPNASRIGDLSLQYKSPGRISCKLELEVVFEK